MQPLLVHLHASAKYSVPSTIAAQLGSAAHQGP